MSDWNMQAQQQQQQQQQHGRQQQQQPYQQRSQSMSVPASQFGTLPAQYPVDYGQQNYDQRRHPPAYPSSLPPLQVNPSSFSQSDVHNLPSSSLPGGPPMTRADRHRAQSVMLTSIGQRDQPHHEYTSSSGYPRTVHRSATGGPSYTSEATVPISRHSSSRAWGGHYPPTDMHPPSETQTPYISSTTTPYSQMGVPSRVMPPLSELDRRGMPTIEEAQPRPKPHVCEQCSAAFSRAHDLKRHIETHKGDRPHKCPTCTKAFSRKDALQRHQSMAQCGVDPQETYE